MSLPMPPCRVTRRVRPRARGRPPRGVCAPRGDWRVRAAQRRPALWLVAAPAAGPGQSQVGHGSSPYLGCDVLQDETAYRLTLTSLVQFAQRGSAMPGTRLLQFMVAVAQTLNEAVRFLRVGSEIGHRIRHVGCVRSDVVKATRPGGRLRDRAAAFRRRLCATASVLSDRGRRSRQRARSDAGAAMSRARGKPNCPFDPILVH